MAGEILIVPLLKKLGLSVAAGATKDGIKSAVQVFFDGPPVHRAFISTKKAFPKKDNLYEALYSWIVEGEFREYLALLKSGQRDFVDDDLIEMFLESCSKNKIDVTRNEAKEIMIKLFDAVERNLYKGDDGLYYWDKKHQSFLRDELNKQTVELKEAMKDVGGDIGNKISEQLTSKLEEILHSEHINETVTHKKHHSLHNQTPPEPNFVGRKKELDTITEWYNDPGVRVGALIAWGGEGKSSIARKFYDELDEREISPDGVFWWGFYRNSSLDAFLDASSHD